MNIHEYQAKSILRKYGTPVPSGYVAWSPDTAVEAAKKIREQTGTRNWAIKAQIHAGGRGKGGGIKIAESLDEVRKYAGEILGMKLITHQTGPEGITVEKILVEQGIYYPGISEIREFYFSIFLNRQTGRNIIIYSTEGGMEIEKVAELTPHLIHREEIDPALGLMPFQTRKIGFNLGLSGKALKEMIKLSSGLYKAFTESDALLIEINPVCKTSDDLIMAADCKIIIDDNAIFRHPEFLDMRDLSQEDPSEIEAGNYNLNFIKLNGNVGCMVNGAGLAMATMDIIKLAGREPANFLDVGGGTNAEKVEAGFRIILKDPKVKAILINIFGGIVRCDRVAQGVVDAYKKIGNIDVPVIVRLQGTNALEGKTLINDSGLKVYSAESLQEAADLVSKLV